MKILMFSLLLAFGLNANEVVYGVASNDVRAQIYEVYNSNYYNYEFAEQPVAVEVGAGERFEIGSIAASFTYLSQGTLVESKPNNIFICVQRGNRPALPVAEITFGGGAALGRPRDSNDNVNVGSFIVGPCAILVMPANGAIISNIRDQIDAFSDLKVHYDLSYKLTKPAASNTTTSAPILLPPTPNAAASWFVKLQMSSDLKTWEDVQAGQFLGSDAARFFRIQTTAAE